MRKTLFASLLMLSSSLAFAAPEDTIREQLLKLDSNIPILSISPAQIQGMYEVELKTGEVLYSDAKGEFYLLGQLYQLSDEKGFVNLTEQKQNAMRKDELAAVKDEKKIVFKAQGVEKSSVYVFTDVDCGYCRKLHQEVPELQKMGISVQYLAFPRGGQQQPAFQKMVNIWCSDDTQKAMSDVKGGGSLENTTCENPVLEQFELGQKLGVNGTPAIFTAEGQQIGGYLPANRLAAVLGIDATKD